MQRIDSANAVASKPAEEAEGVTVGYFQNSIPGVSEATYFSADWCNGLQEEIIALLSVGDTYGVGVETPEKGTLNQAKTQIEKFVSTYVSANGGGSANTEDVVQAGHGFAKYDAIRHNGTIFVKSQADVPANSDVVGIVSEVADTDNFTITYGGIIEWDAPPTPDYTLGEDVWLDPAVAGNLLATEPSYVVGQVRQYIGESVPSGLLVNIDLGEEIDNVGQPVSGVWDGTTEKTVDYTLLAGDDGSMVYLGSGATAERTLTLKSGPSDGDLVWIANQNATYRLKVNDGTDDIQYMFEGECFKFVYSTVLSKWLVTTA